MLGAAERGTLRPDPRGFTLATLPPAADPAAEGPEHRAGDEDDEDSRPTFPGHVPSVLPLVEARLKTPQAPGIPRAPLLPRFTPHENLAPSYAPARDLHAPAGLDLEIAQPGSPKPTEPMPAPPPSSSARVRGAATIPIQPGPQKASLPLSAAERITAPSPGAPGPSATPPTVFQIASWLAERDFESALAAVTRLGAESSPELSLLEVRALVGLGRKAAARRTIDRLCRAPLLDPDVRAAVARLLIDLGDLDRAETQVRRAFADDPDSEIVRLSLAWAVARNAAWQPNERAAAELSELLGRVKVEASSLPALAQALLALALLPSSPEAARKAIDAALARDEMSVDAIAIATVVASRQGRKAEAKRLFQRLTNIDHHASDELAAVLHLDGAAKMPPPPAVPTELAPVAASSRTRADRTAPSSPIAMAGSSPVSDKSPWDEKEVRLARGDARAALFEFEQGLSRRLEGGSGNGSGRAGHDELARAAQITARYLTEAVVSRHFAPYDFSVFSIARLDVALGLLYRGGVGPRTELRTRALLGLGAYSGECLRQAFAGEWTGGTADLLRMHVEGQGLSFSPFRDVHARMQTGEPLEVGDIPVPHPGAEPLGQRVLLSIPPPAPWDPAPWPDVSSLPELGLRLRESPVGLYCAGVELPLDLSFASLRSLDRYVTLLAPPLAPSDPEAPWIRRAAVLVGAYIGEVLRATRGGHWEPLHGEPRADAYRVLLPGGIQAYPIAAAFERLSGRRLEQPSDYARRITG